MRRALIGFVVACLLAIPAVASAQNKKQKAREHFNQGEMYMQAGVYDLAIQEYKTAYKLVPLAHGFLFNIALAYEKWDKPAEALEAYKTYLEKEPEGDKAGETKARIIALDRKLKAAADADAKLQAEAEARRRAQQGDGGTAGGGTGGTGTDPGGTTGLAANGNGSSNGADIIGGPGPADTGKGMKWGWVAAGAGLVVAGLAADLLPDSADNGKVDALDFVPVGLYGLGGFFVIRGVF